MVYLRMQLVVRSSNDRINQWLGSGKDVEGNNHGLIQGIIPKLSWRNQRKPLKPRSVFETITSGIWSNSKLILRNEDFIW
jgi:hypothetical protein